LAEPRSAVNEGLPDVRSGSKADVTLLNFDVRFTPESEYCSALSPCPPLANSRHPI
jgi:hypothetical protein